MNMRWSTYFAAADGLRTVGDLWRYGHSRFAAAGLDCSQGYQNPRDEAAVLVARTLTLEPEDLGNCLLARLTASEVEKVLYAFYQREILRRPSAYVLGEAWFAGRRFAVDERVLIPRSLLEPFIEEGFAPWVNPGRIHRILEVGTGSGCMAVALALRFPKAAVDAVDISSDALALASENIRRHGLEDRIRLLQSDLFSAVHGQKYDLVVSNPPYVDADAMADLPPEYRHEPHLALAAGEDGLSCLLPLLEQAPSHLEPHGVMVVETGDAELALMDRLPDLPLVWLDHPAGGSGVFVYLGDG